MQRAFRTLITLFAVATVVSLSSAAKADAINLYCGPSYNVPVPPTWMPCDIITLTCNSQPLGRPDDVLHVYCSVQYDYFDASGQYMDSRTDVVSPSPQDLGEDAQHRLNGTLRWYNYGLYVAAAYAPSGAHSCVRSYCVTVNWVHGYVTDVYPFETASSGSSF